MKGVTPNDLSTWEKKNEKKKFFREERRSWSDIRWVIMFARYVTVNVELFRTFNV